MPKNINIEDTITAISTSVGEGGIGIVRMSGRDSLKIADKIFKSNNKKKPSQFRTYTTHYGRIMDKGKLIDEVILTVMRSPKSYTKEDIVEINCHGGIVPLKKVLDLVVSLGARMAEPGEFTKRAFLNGRLDLVQAEAVLDVIKSKTDTSLRVAMNQLEGDLSGEVKTLREELLDLCTHVEASIDFPDDEKEIISGSRMLSRLKDIKNKIKKLIDTAESGRVLREVITTVICGKPNVGKSSLMNAFLRQKRVIVSHIPGTTRDIIEEVVNVGGIPLKIVDTAGIIDSEDLLTKEGVSRSRVYIKQADLILFLLDGSEALHQKDIMILDEVKDKKTIVVINKTDLPRKLDIERIKSKLHNKKIIEISVEKKKNLNTLEKAITDLVWHGHVESDRSVLITNIRHKQSLLSAHDAINNTLASFEKKLSGEFVAVGVKEAIDSLGDITGETLGEDILDRIFSEFCIGK